MLIERMRERLTAERASFIEPCLPSPADKPPSGSNWIHEIKHDGFRLMARRDPVGIRLITRRGNDWTSRYPLVAEAVNHLKVRSCLIDGEVVYCDEKGVAAFQLLRHRRSEPKAFLYAFDLLELNGTTARADRGTQGNAGKHPAEEPAWCEPERAPGALGRGCRIPARLPRWGWRGSCRRGWDRATGPAAHRSRIRPHGR
jgi:ATP dependent DNA ligase domain